MKTRTILVTGSSGLIGSEVVTFFANRGYAVHGIDNNMRETFFGPQGSTRWNQQRLERDLARFRHHELDMRDRAGVLALVRDLRPDGIAHTAAQPSHDRAAAIPFDDFDTNAVGTLNLLEAARQYCPEAPFVHMSTNKVYGDAPEPVAAGGARHPLGLCRRSLEPRHPPSPSRSTHASIRCLVHPRLQRTCWCRNVTLSQHANLLPARRMPDGTQPQRCRVAWIP